MSAARRELVEAGAGCGKTESLVTRYIEALGYDAKTGQAKGLVANRLRPSDIVALTFTEDAAQQMKDRVMKRLDSLQLSSLRETVQEESQIGTFHSFCYKLLRPHFKALGYPSNATIVLPAVARLLRKRHVMRYLADYPQREALLARLGLHQIAQLGADLWFSTTTSGEQSLGEFFTRNQQVLANFREQSLDDLDTLFSKFPEAIEANAWPRAFAAALENPGVELAQKIEFRAGRKLTTEFPDLARRAKDYREFLLDKFHLALAPASEWQELAAQKEMREFLNLAVKSGPKLLDFSALEFELSQRLGDLRKCRLLIVDEFQDTNRGQFSILEAISAPETEWYFVGDPKQSIYGFRGADVSLFLEMRHKLLPRALDVNYRSTPAVLNFVNLLQNDLFDPSRPLDPPPQVLTAGKAYAGTSRVDVREVAAKHSTFESVVEDFQRASEGKTSESHAALFLTWKQLHRFAAHLETAQIPFEIAGSTPHLKHSLTGIFAELLLWLDDPGNPTGLTSLVRWSDPNWNARLADDADFKRVQGHFQDFETATWNEILAMFCDFIGPGRWEAGGLWAAAMEMVLEQLEALQLAERFSLTDLGRFLRSNEAAFDVDLPARPRTKTTTGSKLLLLTIHGSKGLEFDSVYLPELYERAKRSLSDVIEDDDNTTFSLNFEEPNGLRRKSFFYTHKQHLEKLKVEAETRRLFYVALTRAKKHLSLYFHTPAAQKDSADPLRVLAWPTVTRTLWNRLLHDGEARGQFSALEGAGELAWASLETSDVDPPVAGEFWSLPAW